MHRDRLSLSRLNHGQPGVQAHPEIVQGTAELHHESADALLPQADAVFHNATTLHTLLLTCSIRRRRWWSTWLARCCSRVSSAPRGFFVGMRISTSGSVNDRKPRACNN